MATNTTDEADETLKSATNITGQSVESSSDDDNDLDIDDCVCLIIWKQIIEEQDSMREFLLSTLENRPTIAREIRRILETKNEEATREITHLIQDICPRCQKMHSKIKCNEDDDHNYGCDTRHHHDLE